MLSGDAGWAISFGDAGSDSVWGGDVAADGGSYLVGRSASSSGGFVRKFDAAGEPLWTVAATQGTTADAFAVVEGDQGSVYALMQFSQPVTIGGQQFTSRGGADVLLLEVDANDGFVQNVTQLGGTANDMGVAIDFEAGDLFVTGSANDGLWVARLDTAGNELWTKSFGGIDSAVALGFGVDATSDGVYVTGRFGEQTISFDGVELTPRGGHDIFVARLAPANGSVIWANRFGGDGDTVNEHGGSLVVDELNDRLYVAGVYNTVDQSTADFGSLDLMSAGDDIFVMQLENIATSNPSVTWARRIASDGQESLMLDSLAIDVNSPDTRLYLTGTFGALEQPADFDPDPVGERILTPTGFRDAFVSVLDGNGNYVSAWPLSSLTSSGGKWVGLAPDGMLYAAGEFDGRLTAPAGQTLEAAGARTADQAYSDVYLVKLNPDLGFIKGNVFADSPELVENEPGLVNWTVRADDGQTQVTAQTDLWGNYSLPVAPGQSYQVALAPPAEWQQTVPVASQSYTVNYSNDPSMVATGYDFGATTASLTRTQYQTNPGARIKDGQTVTSSITVNDSFDLRDVNVTVDIQHPDVGNLAITLISPAGTAYPLTCFDGTWHGYHPGVGGVGANYTNTTFNEEAEQTFEQGSAPYTGEFQPLPVVPLAELRGTSVQGEWTLEVRDTSWTRNSPGRLRSWSLDTTSITVTEMNDPPIADAGGSYTGNEGSDIALDASGSSDLDGTIASYEWDLDNNGQYDDAAGPTATFNSVADGTFTVGLRVTDSLGATGTDTATITVSNVAPTADAGGPYMGTEGNPIALSAAGSSDPGNDIASYAWDFDLDGQYDDATGVAPNFSSSTAGTYTVGVRVTDDNGATGTDTATVTVDPASDATMNVADLEGSSTSVNKKKWRATVTIKVEESGGGLVSGATVQGTWSNGVVGTASTNSSGIATVTSTNVSKTSIISFTVDSIFHTTLTYKAGDNRDEGGDYSNGTTITVAYGDTLLAARGLMSAAPAASLTQEQANATAAQAIALWSQQLVTVPQINVTIADLPAGILGWAYDNTVTLDVNADGAGWYTHQNAPLADQYDLLTVVSHEIGHLLGYGHSDHHEDLMAATLPIGTRRLPGLEPSIMEPALLASLPNLQMNTSTLVIDSPTPAKLLDPVAEANFDLFPAPLVMDRVQESTGSPEVLEVRILDDILDEETELVEDELLDLLLSQDRQWGQYRGGTKFSHAVFNA